MSIFTVTCTVAVFPTLSVKVIVSVASTEYAFVILSPSSEAVHPSIAITGSFKLIFTTTCLFTISCIILASGGALSMFVTGCSLIYKHRAKFIDLA